MFQLLRIFIALIGYVLIASPGFSQDKPDGNPENISPLILDEILVSEPMRQKLSSIPIPFNILNDEELSFKSAGTLGETISQEQGIHNQSFGSGVGLPVIRGQSGPRVRVLSNGLGANDASQVSPDHSSSTVPLLAEQIEVLRGPATLLYGSGAIGGIVNVIDNRIPEVVPEKIAGGTLEQRFNSVSDETSTAIKLEGGKKHFAYHLDGFYRNQGNVKIGSQAIDVSRAQVSEPSLAVTQNTRGIISNSSANSFSGSGGFSLIGDPGFIGLSGNILENNYKLPPNGTASAENVTVEVDQNKFDFKSTLKKPVNFFSADIRLHMSYTDYQHKEVANNQVEARFNNDTYEGRIEVPHTPLGPLKGVVGFHAIASEFSAIKVDGNESLVPLSHINNFAAFAQESFDVGPVETQLGIRVEHATLDPQGSTNPYRSFTPVSVSTSGLWKMDKKNTFNIGITRSQRAPQVQELFFSGSHEATRSFERGNANLGNETAYNLDLGYKFRSDRVTLELDLFHNWANDYITQQRTGSFVAGEPEVLTQQANAIFMGYEAKLNFSLMNNESGLMDLTLFSDFTRGRFTDLGDVPQMPPLRWGFELSYAMENWNSSLRLTRGQAQNDPGANEASTPGYALLNINTRYRILDFKGADLLLFAKGNNLLDENIRNSTSFLRNFSPEPGRGAEFGVRINY
jgi:iron complex outermembrane receptor protein